MDSTGRFDQALNSLRARSYDRCQSCGVALPREVAAYAGYAVDGSPRYVGNCCVGQIHELATHVYWWWEADKRVDSDTLLWRYMDCAKFLDLLERRSLFFARADKLGDPFEGASGVAEREGEWDQFYLNYFRDIVRHPPEGSSVPSNEEVEASARRLLSQIREGAESDRKSTFVSCWHANTGESEALWRLYCPAGSTGIAIQTTADRLTKALGIHSDIKLGRVQYVDFRKSFAGFHDRIFWKRSSLQHEAEVRAVFRNRFPEDCSGVSLLVDVETLCASIVPSPFAPPWFEGLLRALITRYGFNLTISPSELLAQPFF